MNQTFMQICPSCGERAPPRRFCSNCGSRTDELPRSCQEIAEAVLKDNGYSDMASLAQRPAALGRLAQAFNAGFDGIAPSSVLVFTATMSRRDIPRILDVVLLLELEKDEAWKANAIAVTVANTIKAAAKAAKISRFRTSILVTVYVFYDEVDKTNLPAIHRQASSPFSFWLARPQISLVALDLRTGERLGSSNSVSELHIDKILRDAVTDAGAPPAQPAEDGFVRNFVSEHLAPALRILRELRVALNPELIAYRIKAKFLTGKELFGIAVAGCVLALAVDKIFQVNDLEFVDLPIIGEMLSSAFLVSIWALVALVLFPLLKLFGGRATLRETIIATVYAFAIIVPFNFVVYDAFAQLPEEMRDGAHNVSNILSNLYFWPVLAALHDLGALRMLGAVFSFYLLLFGAGVALGLLA